MFMFLPTLLIVLLDLPESSTAETGTQSFTALKFNYDANSYIAFSPDMSPLADKFSVCLWIRKLQSGHIPCPFAYNRYEIFMTDSGYYNRVFGSSSLDGKLTSKFTTPQGSWYFYCATWSIASRTFRVYHNGELVGTDTTPSGRGLQTGGTLVLGNYLARGGHQFGGEIFNFNIFSRELTASEVTSLNEIGLCTPVPESLEDYRTVKWEDILQLSRSGTVQDIDTGCAAVVELNQKLAEKTQEKEDVELSLNRTLEDLREVQGNFNSSQEELSAARGQIGTLKEELNNTRVELTETKIDLEMTKADLMNVTQSKCVLQKGNLTKWDVFYSPDYYNKTFTRQLYRKLQNTWETISSRLFGMTITDKLIELIKDLDDGEIETCGDLDS
ncbi:hypothetical protein ACHWQZ_G003134 [Mnemiopsis leidyi]